MISDLSQTIGSRKPQESEQDFLQSFNEDQDEGFVGATAPGQDSIRERLRKYGEKKEEVESTSEFFKRNIGQHAARAAETLTGYAGNLKKAINQTREFLEESVNPGGKKLSQMEEEAIGTPQVESLHHRIMNPPTSSELRNEVTPAIAEKLDVGKDYFEPRGKGEEAAGELTTDLTAMFQPGTGPLRLITKIGAPIVGNLTKQGVKFLGGDEKLADQAKMGMMLATTIAAQSNPAQFSQQRIAQAREMIPADATVHVGPLANNLMNLYNRVTRGLRVPSKSRAIQGMQDLAEQVQNNRIPMRNLMDARNDINEWIAEAGGFDVPAAVRDRTIANLNELKRQVIDTIETNLNQRFPQAGELYRTGYEAAAVTHQSQAISNFIEKYFGRKLASASAKVLFPGLAGGAAVIPKTAAVATATIPIYKAGQVLYRVGNSPTLARYYGEVIRASSQGNIPAMVKNMDKLDKELLKDEQKQEKKTPKSKVSLEDFKSRFKGKG